VSPEFTRDMLESNRYRHLDKILLNLMYDTFGNARGRSLRCKKTLYGIYFADLNMRSHQNFYLAFFGEARGMTELLGF
jgi:hypothetical protein